MTAPRGPARWGSQLEENGRGAEGEGARIDAELAVVVRAPAVDGGARDGAGVCAARGDARRPIERDTGGRQPIVGRSVAELASVVRAPAPDLAVLEEGAGVRRGRLAIGDLDERRRLDRDQIGSAS